MSCASSIFQRLSQPLLPLPSDTEPRLVRFSRVRAVMFDIYGTLVISASGDVGTRHTLDRPAAFAAALEACGIEVPSGDDVPGVEALAATIGQHHQRAREAGIDYPEVNILDVWSDVWHQWHEQGLVATPAGDVDFARLAVEFEARANPSWPMPGAESCLEALRQRGVLLGLISNAQFFTRELVCALFGRSEEELGFDSQLCYYSYEHGHAKPSRHMFELAAARLRSREIAAHEVLYVGNDVRNDILPAAAVGFRAVLFAGDGRSLRWRNDDPLAVGVEPVAVVTDLKQIPEMCVP